MPTVTFDNEGRYANLSSWWNYIDVILKTIGAAYTRALFLPIFGISLIILFVTRDDRTKGIALKTAIWSVLVFIIFRLVLNFNIFTTINQIQGMF